ncbi:MAG: hypothetical protein RJB39_71 [Candidatus Parcubacteria bacterium]|jgi:hypothetical protein
MPSLLTRIKKLHQLFHSGKILTLAQHEVHPENPKGSRENYLYFTLPPSLNFQRQSPAMWRAAFATWHDTETNYLFFPERVVHTPYSKVQTDLRKHKLSLQLNKHTDIWITLCKTFNEEYKSDPRELIKKFNANVSSIIQELQTNKKKFPYLNGAKMSNYWLYILDQYTDIKLKNKQLVSIIPDTHVAQCSAHLGITKEGASPEEIAAEWFKTLEGSGLTPVEMHPVLWNWSRNNFQPEV